MISYLKLEKLRHTRPCYHGYRLHSI